MKKCIRAKKIWFIIPIILFTIGIIGSVTFGLKAYKLGTRPKAYFTLPSETNIEITETGTKEIYYEYTMAYQIKENIIFYFRNIETGEVVESYIPTMNATYFIGSKNGVLVAQVDLSQAGNYLVSSNYDKDNTELLFWVGNGLAESIVFTLLAVFVGIFGFLGGIISIVIILIVTKYLQSQKT